MEGLGTLGGYREVGMNVSVMQENLARGLQTVSRAVSSRATLPVLANVLLKTESSGLKLTATNLEIGINCWVPGKVAEEGEITVPARLLTDLVASLPNQRIDLVLSPKDRTLKLTCGNNRSSIKGIEADEFPVVAAIGEAPATSIDARVLREALGEVVFAAASDESRPILTGVLTRLNGDTMTLAAADNYRIAVRTLKLEKPVSPGDRDRRARPLVRGADADPARRRGADRDHGHAEQEPGPLPRGGHRPRQPPDRGPVPELRAGHPDLAHSRAVIDREAFLAGTRRASIFARDSANIVKIELGGEDGDGTGVAITAHAADVGDNADTVEAAIEGLADGDRLQRPLPDRRAERPRRRRGRPRALRPAGPGVIRGIGKDDYVHVIMPVRTAS